MEVAAVALKTAPTVLELRSDRRGSKRPLCIKPRVEFERFGFTDDYLDCDAIKGMLGCRQKHAQKCKYCRGRLMEAGEELLSRVEDDRQRVATRTADAPVADATMDVSATAPGWDRRGRSSNDMTIPAHEPSSGSGTKCIHDGPSGVPAAGRKGDKRGMVETIQTKRSAEDQAVHNKAEKSLKSEKSLSADVASDAYDEEQASEVSLDTSLLLTEFGAHNADVNEVFDPDFLCGVLLSLGLSAGHAFDMAIPNLHSEMWDFNRDDHQARREQRVRNEEPASLVGFTMCKGFGTSFSVNVKDIAREKLKMTNQHVKRLKEVNFEAYEMQRSEGRWFLREHLWGAWSLTMDFAVKLTLRKSIQVLGGHMCAHGQHYLELDGSVLVSDRTGWMSNLVIILVCGALRCDNKKWHRPMRPVDGKIGPCEQYPNNVIERILKRLKEQLKAVRRMSLFGIGVACEEQWELHNAVPDDGDDDEKLLDGAGGAYLPVHIVCKGWQRGERRRRK